MSEGGSLQQSAIGGVNSASSSISVRSFGRSYTQTLSSLSTAKPVMPPIFHLFGSVFGQSGSNLNFGAASSDAPSTEEKWPARKRLAPTNTAQIARTVTAILLAELAQPWGCIQRIFTNPPRDAKPLWKDLAESMLRESACQRFRAQRLRPERQ